MGGRDHTVPAVYGIFFLLGVGSSLPWNVFITAQDYFAHRLAGTDYEGSFLNWFAMAFNVSNLMTMLVRTVCVGERMPSAVRSTFVSLVIIIGVMFSHCLLTRTPEYQGYGFFYLTMTSILVVSGASTIMQDGLLRISPKFPPQYTQAVIAGQAMAGLAVSTSNFCILWADQASPKLLLALQEDADLCAFLYFVLVFITLVVCVLAFGLLIRMQIFRHYQSVDHPAHKLHRKHSKAYLAGDAVSATDTDDSSKELLLPEGEDAVEVTHDGKVDLVELAYKIRLYSGTVFLVFVVTLGVFPSLTSSIKSTQPERGRFFRDLFTPFTLILFNLGDFLSRLVAASLPEPSPRKLLLGAVARFVFIPLFLLCNLQNDKHQTITIVLFDSDVLALLFLLTCAFTNGLLTTLAFMYYPRVLDSNKEKELGGTTMIFIVSVGLTAGSLMSFVLPAMLKP